MDLRNVDYEGGAPLQRSFLGRLWGAALVDATVYEEVEHDTTALAQAAGVILLVSVARAFGVGVGFSIFGAIVAGFLSWGFGSLVVWLIGVKVLGATSDLREVLRTLGFASAPHLGYAIGVLPLGALTDFAFGGIWVIGVLAWVVAARQALDLTTGRAVGVCLVASLPSLFFALLLDVLLVAGV